MFSSSDIIIFDSIAIDADIKCEFILTFILVFTLFRRSLRQKNLRAKFCRRTRFLCVLHFHDEREGSLNWSKTKMTQAVHFLVVELVNLTPPK